jgi:hypothetical protein
VLGREPLEQRVGVRRVAHCQRPELELLPDAVEDDDAAGALEGDEARERSSPRGASISPRQEVVARTGTASAQARVPLAS